METDICRNCQKKAEVKCYTCNEFYCSIHDHSCKIDPFPHHLINWPPVNGTLFEDLKKKLLDYYKQIESSSTKIVNALISIKRKVLMTVQSDLEFIDKLEKEFQSNSIIGFNQNTVLNKYLSKPSEELRTSLLSTITFSDSFKKIIQDLNLITNPISFNKDSLQKSESINSRPVVADLHKEILSAEMHANFTFSKLVEFKREFTNNIGLSNIFQIMKMEQVSYRETVTDFIINYENCSSNKAVKIICDSLALFPNLHTLIFERLTPDQVEILLPFLKIPDKVKHFSMDRCVDIGPLEMKELKKKCENLNLESFCFKSCNCLSEGINLVVSKIAVNRLTHLILPGNLLGYEGSKGLSYCLAKFSCLTHLNLRNNDLTVREMLILKPCFNGLSNLRHLDIAVNELKINGIKELLKGLQMTRLLAFLDISSNKLADENDEQIKIMLLEDFRELKLLQTLVLDMTIKKDHLNVLREILPKFTNIFNSNSELIQSLPKNMNS